MPKTSKKPASKAAICRKWKITPKTLESWIAEGVNHLDDAAMAARVAQKPCGAGGDEMRAARLKKLRAEALCAELKADELSRNSIAIDEVKRAFAIASSVVRAGVMRLCADLPIQLEGLSAAAMSSIIRDHCTKLLSELSEPTSELWEQAEK